MTKIYSRSIPIEADIVDAFCVLQKGFTDQFVYFDKEHTTRYMGLGRCIALPTLDDVDYEYESGRGKETTAESPVSANENPESASSPSPKEENLMDDRVSAVQPAIFFSFNRFDVDSSAPADELFASFPRLRFMLPEVVLIDNELGRFLQVNSLGPVYAGRIDRFVRICAQAPRREHVSIPYTLEPDSHSAWSEAMDEAAGAITEGRVRKVVLSRRQKLVADHPFSSKDLLVNLIDGSAWGTVIMYRYADVFFCGCTPELLVRKRGHEVESMCLAGTCPAGEDEREREHLAADLMSDSKNRVEHDYVVDHVRAVFERMCYDVDIPQVPSVLTLAHVQHLNTPVHARALEGVSLWDLEQSLHPTPATCGTPVGEAKMLIRRIEPYQRGFYAGTVGFVNGEGDGEFSVALRSGVFDGEIGWVYAGCGIVSKSDVDDEHEEISLKLKTILSAFEAPYDDGKGDDVAHVADDDDARVAGDDDAHVAGDDVIDERPSA